MKPLNFNRTHALMLLSAFVLAGCNQGFELVAIQPSQNSNNNIPDPDQNLDPTDPDAGDPSGGTPPGGGGQTNTNYVLTNAIESDTQTPSVSANADILFVIDNSGSMAAEQETLASNFSSFINGITAVNSNFNYRIGITSTDFDGTTGVSFTRTNAYTNFRNFGPGGLIQRWISPAASTPLFLSSEMDPIFVRNQFVNSAKLGTGGSGAENGIETFRRFLTLSNPGGVNADFLRDENTKLDVIVISDEDAHNPLNTSQYLRANPTQFNSYLDETVAQIAQAKNGRGANMIKFHSIAGFENSPSTCSLYSTGGLRGEGVAYFALSNRTGGMKIDLCRTNNFANDLLTLGSVIGSSIRRVFSLAHTPSEIASIRVFLNGNPVAQNSTNGFTYNSSSNSIMLHGLNLESMTTIETRIEYTYLRAVP